MSPRTNQDGVGVDVGLGVAVVNGDASVALGCDGSRLLQVVHVHGQVMVLKVVGVLQVARPENNRRFLARFCDGKQRKKKKKGGGE